MKRGLLSLIVLTAFLLTMWPLSVTASATTWTFDDLQGYYKTQGRVAMAGTALTMDTTSSGFEFCFEGSGDVTLQATVKCTYSTDLYLSVIVDGVYSRMQVDAGVKGSNVSKTLALAKDLPYGVHHIEVYKQSEAIVTHFAAKSVSFEGTPLATPPLDKITMEVVGDSISSGASMWSAATHNDAIPADYPYYLDGTKTYAYLAGEAIGANVRVTQASGYGCVDGYNTDGMNLQKLFPYTNYWRNQSALYAFDPPAQIVVINLGTNDGMSGKVTDAAFKEGAKNLMTLAREKNPDAKVVWCTGMMGTFFPTVLKEAVAELGGSENGYFYCELPYGVDGGYGHPNVAQHATAANTLKNFLLQNCLPADHQADFSDTEALTALVNRAKAIPSPSAALTSALQWAECELRWGTTDPYRLGCRYDALEAAMNGELSVDLMPQAAWDSCPMADNGSYIWPYYGAVDGSVTLYKGGEGYYWPHIEVLKDVFTVNVNDTPYLYLKTAGTSYFNLHLTFKDKTGEIRTVTASELAGNGATDFAAGERELRLDLKTYMVKNGYADAKGNVVLLACDLFASGEMDVYTTLYACCLTESDGTGYPTAIEGDYPVADGLLTGVTCGTTAEELLARMNGAAYLSVTDESGKTVDDRLGTGMILRLTVNGTELDSAVIVVTGDVTGDGVSNTADCRVMLGHMAGTRTCSAAQLKAADSDRDGVAETSDVRTMLKACLM